MTAGRFYQSDHEPAEQLRLHSIMLTLQLLHQKGCEAPCCCISLFKEEKRFVTCAICHGSVKPLDDIFLHVYFLFYEVIN